MNNFKKLFLLIFLGIVAIPHLVGMERTTTNEITPSGQESRKRKRTQTSLLNYFSPTTPKSTNLVSLPTEILASILSHLSDEELKNARIVNSIFNSNISKIVAPQKAILIARNLFVTILEYLCDETIAQSFEHEYQHIDFIFEKICNLKKEVTVLSKCYEPFIHEEFLMLMQLLLNKELEAIGKILNQTPTIELLSKIYNNQDIFYNKLLKIAEKYSLLYFNFMEYKKSFFGIQYFLEIEQLYNQIKTQFESSNELKDEYFIPKTNIFFLRNMFLLDETTFNKQLNQTIIIPLLKTLECLLNCKTEEEFKRKLDGLK